MGNSTPNRPETLTIFFIQVFYRWPQKIKYTNLQIFLKISRPVMVKIVDLALKAIIDYFEIYNINSLIIKKNSRLISFCPKLYLEESNQNKKILLLLLKEVLVHVNNFFNIISLSQT